jgi:hypothetical protein
MYLLPKPQNLEYDKGYHVIKYDERIIIDKECFQGSYHLSKILKKDIEEKLGFTLQITKGQVEKECICIKKDASLMDEEYKLSISPEIIEITGGHEKAILYGIQTLRQIIAQKGAVIPCMVIRDYPDMKNRGYYFDITRGRIPTLTYLKELADRLSYYKINQLQLYVEHSFLFKELSEVWRDDTPLTAEDILELDNYCSSIHIELVPSLASFGHLYKLLSTKTYSHLCELPDSEKQGFSFDDRMQHHTIDATNEESLIVIKKLIDEYIPLFSSNQFNLCADETFDLGKGKSKPLAEERGVLAIYMDYIKDLCQHLVQQGKRPMFWGDVISSFPEAINHLPADTICLNWGYHPEQNEDFTRKLDEAGAIQYLCPGVGGWNQFINLIESSYKNITRMCSYAHKYKALGVLNTDWGDFGHVNHPEFSTTGMIYGASFSWNQEILPFEEINKQISKLEYKDDTEKFVDSVSALATNSIFEWYSVVRYMEMSPKQVDEKEINEFLPHHNLESVTKANQELQSGIYKLYELINYMDNRKRSVVKPYILAAEGMMLFNSIAATISQYKYHITNEASQNPSKLAVRLEYWFYHYKELWRTVSKESELYRLQNLIIWYADHLRSFI